MTRKGTLVLNASSNTVSVLELRFLTLLRWGWKSRRKRACGNSAIRLCRYICNGISSVHSLELRILTHIYAQMVRQGKAARHFPSFLVNLVVLMRWLASVSLIKSPPRFSGGIVIQHRCHERSASTNEACSRIVLGRCWAKHFSTWWVCLGCYVLGWCLLVLRCS
jgi:hypothetical protein